MPRYDFRTPRLYVDAPLKPGGEVPLNRGQANYLLNVLRLKRDDEVLLFNGRDGEFRATLAGTGKRAAATVAECLRPQPVPHDLHFLFAPLKHARLDYLVQKAVEMGASRLQPVTTQHTQVTRINLERMQANTIEAAEQCGILTLPEVAKPVTFQHVVRADRDRLLVFCDEAAEVKNPVSVLEAARPAPSALLPAEAARAPVPMAVLIGPEGGFSEEEREALLKRPNTIRFSLGPRILRADTAAVAALALVQAVLGDWQGSEA
jgi:16S rRNA (uracil1498-N3)-methyltransferase